MFRFSNYLMKNVLGKTIVFFAIVLLILNLSLYYIINAYEAELLLQKENSFTEVVKHLYSENDVDYVFEYLEHYSHINNTAIIVISGEVLFETSIKGEDYREYLIDTNITLKIDSSMSNTVVLSDMLSIISNLVFLAAFAVSMLIFYRISKRKADFMVKDLEIFRSKMKRYDLTDYNFSFIEFKEVFDEFVFLNNELSDINLLKKDKLQSVKHDLNTSLTVIKSYLEGFLHGRMDLNQEEVIELLEEVNFNTALIEKLGTDVIDEDSTLNLSVLLEKITKKYQHIFNTKDILMVENIKNDVFIKGNENTVVRVIQNILSNAFYYSERSTKVTITLTSDTNPVIIIQDQGIGISKENLKKIFIKEFRAPESKHRNANGRGIGLYTSRALMQEMNGNIELISNNEGTEVKIIFSS